MYVYFNLGGAASFRSHPARPAGEPDDGNGPNGQTASFSSVQLNHFLFLPTSSFSPGPGENIPMSDLPSKIYRRNREQHAQSDRLKQERKLRTTTKANAKKTKRSRVAVGVEAHREKRKHKKKRNSSSRSQCARPPQPTTTNRPDISIAAERIAPHRALQATHLLHHPISMTPLAPCAMLCLSQPTTQSSAVVSRNLLLQFDIPLLQTTKKKKKIKETVTEEKKKKEIRS